MDPMDPLDPIGETVETVETKIITEKMSMGESSEDKTQKTPLAPIRETRETRETVEPRGIRAMQRLKTPQNSEVPAINGVETHALKVETWKPIKVLGRRIRGLLHGFRFLRLPSYPTSVRPGARRL